MSTLSLDPGIHTGWAILNEDIEVLAYGTLQSHELGLLDPSHPHGPFLNITKVVIEDTPIPTIGQMNSQLRNVIVQLESWYPNAVKIKPGVWKPTPAGHLALPSHFTPHEKDSIRLGTFFLTRELRSADAVSS